MSVSFRQEYVKTEDEAISLLPKIRGQVEVQEANWGERDDQRMLIARTRTINAVIMLYYTKHHLDKEIDGISWLAVYQDYPFFLYGYLYQPLWSLFFKLT